MDILHDSITTSVSMKIFKSKEESFVKHMSNSKLIYFSTSQCKVMNNFDIERLQHSSILLLYIT